MEHNFNENKKRFEPIETICQFCLKNRALDIEKNYYRPVFKVLNRTNIVVYSSVKFNKVSVGISRCHSCFDVHRISNRNSYILSISIALIVIYFGFSWFGLYGFISFFLSIVIIFLIPSFLITYLVHKEGITTEQEAVVKDRFIRDLVLNGWSLTGPTP